jgi:hypothetical protein
MSRGSSVGIATELRAGLSGVRIPVGEKFFALVQTGLGAHPASCTMGTGSFPGVKSGRGVTLTLHPLLVPWSRKSKFVPLLPLWAVRPVQSLSACTDPQCLHRASVPVQRFTLPLLYFNVCNMAVVTSWKLQGWITFKWRRFLLMLIFDRLSTK